MKISTILDQIDLGAIALPEFQRGYVWNREQVRGLMQSLYRRHPVGSLLVWVTRTEQADARGDAVLPPGSVELLLDGQQRITSLYGIIRGHPPTFFDGDKQRFTGLHFNLEDETFEFYAPVKMGGNSLWVDVSALMASGSGAFIQKMVGQSDLAPKLQTYIDRLNRVDSIKEIELHIEKVTGEDKTVEVVVDIFNRVNSGGTKLSKGDLALAQICASWPDARTEMKTRLDQWGEAGYDFRLEWLLRVVNAIVTGEALFTALDGIDTSTFREGLVLAEKSVNTLLNLIAARLGLDHDRVLGSRYSFPLMARYLVQRGGHLSDYREQDKLLYWYVHSFLWGRYAGSTESVLNQDLALIEDADGALDRLIVQLRQNRGDLRVTPGDFVGWSRGARFYPLLYMLTRVHHARDWGSGLELSQGMLGQTSSLEVHHIFPKALLYKHGYTRPDVNAVANFTFLTQTTNLQISDHAPAEYLEEVALKHPGAIESHWIPMDRNLWKIEEYPAFLAARRELLARAANEFLNSLVSADQPKVTVPLSLLERVPVASPVGVPGAIEGEDEERMIEEANAWVVERGLPRGEIAYDLADEESGETLAVFDLAWPDGLQEGFSQPVTLLLNEGRETEEAANRAGFHYFTDVGEFKEYVDREILALPIAEA